MPISVHCFTVCIQIFCSSICTEKIQNEPYIKMRIITTRGLKKSAAVNKEDFIFSKLGQYSANLISRIELVIHKTWDATIKFLDRGKRLIHPYESYGR
jgi:hypothetical protein